MHALRFPRALILVAFFSLFTATAFAEKPALPVVYIYAPNDGRAVTLEEIAKQRPKVLKKSKEQTYILQSPAYIRIVDRDFAELDDYRDGFADLDWGSDLLVLDGHDLKIECDNNFVVSPHVYGVRDPRAKAASKVIPPTPPKAGNNPASNDGLPGTAGTAGADGEIGQSSGDFTLQAHGETIGRPDERGIETIGTMTIDLSGQDGQGGGRGGNGGEAGDAKAGADLRSVVVPGRKPDRSPIGNFRLNSGSPDVSTIARAQVGGKGGDGGLPGAGGKGGTGGDAGVLTFVAKKFQVQVRYRSAGGKRGELGKIGKLGGSTSGAIGGLLDPEQSPTARAKSGADGVKASVKTHPRHAEYLALKNAQNLATEGKIGNKYVYLRKRLVDPNTVPGLNWTDLPTPNFTATVEPALKAEVKVDYDGPLYWTDASETEIFSPFFDSDDHPIGVADEPLDAILECPYTKKFFRYRKPTAAK